MDKTEAVVKLVRRTQRLVGPRLAEIATSTIYRKAFFSSREWRNLAFGQFASFQEAGGYAQKYTSNTIYKIDHESWLSARPNVQLHDYPMLHWFAHFSALEPSVIDIGGSVGVTYYVYSKMLQWLTAYSWQVLELPDVVEQGRKLAIQRNNSTLSFVSSWEELKPASILLCAGAAQFLPMDLAVHVREMKEQPSVILINRVPIHSRKSYVTLQNTGSSITPCKVWERREFIDSFEVLGYTLVDDWSCAHNSLYVPYHPDLTLHEFRGYCFLFGA